MKTLGCYPNELTNMVFTTKLVDWIFSTVKKLLVRIFEVVFVALHPRVTYHQKTWLGLGPWVDVFKGVPKELETASQLAFKVGPGEDRYKWSDMGSPYKWPNIKGLPGVKSP